MKSTKTTEKAMLKAQTAAKPVPPKAHILKLVPDRSGETKSTQKQAGCRPTGN